MPVTVPVDQEVNPWLAAAARFDEAAAKLKLDDGMCKVLRSPAREITVNIPVQLDDGRLEVFTGYRVQHSIARGPGKGGIRVAPDVTLDELREWTSGLDSLLHFHRPFYDSGQLCCGIRLLNKCCNSLGCESPDGFHFVISARNDNSRIGAQNPDLPERFLAAHDRHGHVKQYDLYFIRPFAE